MNKDTSKSGYSKGDVVKANGFPGVVTSPTRGTVTQVAVFGWGYDIGDTYNSSITPWNEKDAQAAADANGYGFQFHDVLGNMREKKRQDDKKKAAKAAKKVAL